jgi:uncharacterized protein CbrC (UPF0167 family)
MKLPTFKYHPDLIATGSIVVSYSECCCCGMARGYIYIGPVYAIEKYNVCIGPWCIADGSAHKKLQATFTDEAGIGGYGEWEDVPVEVIVEVAYNTPGFIGWQQERWWALAEMQLSSLAVLVIWSLKHLGSKPLQLFMIQSVLKMVQNGIVFSLP